jgi:ribose transport system substrate-binding protein
MPARLLPLAFLLGSMAVAVAAESSRGITEPVVFPPFDPDVPACGVPADLSRVLVFAKDNQREFIEGVDHGLTLASRDRDISYRVLLADNDPQKQIEQIGKLPDERTGALVVSPVDPGSLAPVLEEVIGSGAYVGTIVPPPATSILNAPQYLTGKELGDAAASYIRERLGGRASVVLLTQDSIQFLAPRFVAIRDTLRQLPGVTIVADISPSPVSKEGGFATMETVLLAHPDVDVVLGADAVVLGALQALRAAGKDGPDKFLGGIDGEPEAIAEIKKGGSYKTTITLNSPVFGYAMGQHAADWLEGKSIPQAMDILPRAVSVGNITAYETDLADPASVYRDPARRDSYLRMYGNICYDTRDRFVNFPWSSEAR